LLVALKPLLQLKYVTLAQQSSLLALLSTVLLILLHLLQKSQKSLTVNSRFELNLCQ
jgi:hypothetical protein